jgi:hypothetical protein
MEDLKLMAQHEDLDILGVDTPDRCDDSSEKYAANVVGERYQVTNLPDDSNGEETIRGHRSMPGHQRRRSGAGSAFPHPSSNSKAKG